MLKRLNRPWLHFLLLGYCLYSFNQWMWPPPKPSVGPLPASRVEVLKKQWFATTGRVPQPAELQRMIAAELDRDILFQEALDLDIYRYDTVVRQRLLRNMSFLRLGEGKTEEEMYTDALRMELHLGDEVVKRRLIQVMEQLLLAGSPPQPLSEADIVAEFEANTAEFRRPRRYSIEHVFITRDREPEIAALQQRIESEQLSASQARQLSSPFLPGYVFRGQSPEQLARHFGSGFVLNLQALEPGAQSWSGPVESTYGYHLVWVDAIEEERDAELAEVRRQIERDLTLQRRNQALREAVAELREHYEVIL
jgi:hypothetical protein